jgi:hypothetical protein
VKTTKADGLLLQAPGVTVLAAIVDDRKVVPSHVVCGADITTHMKS